MSKNKAVAALVPLLMALGVVGGIFIGRSLFRQELTPKEEKMREILGLIHNEYVDSISQDYILETAYSNLLSSLDPHSVYIPAKDVEAVNDELSSSFSGVGVSFQIVSDTVNIIEIVAGGPAEFIGLRAGDKVLSANGVDLTGKNATNENVFKNLRGEKGTEVELVIKRSDSSKPLHFTVTRGDVPQTSVDSYYMLDDKAGYIRVNKFARTTYQEFMHALQLLQAKGAEKFVIDLRGNSGGFLDQAELMANEFLPAGRVIVSMKGNNPMYNSVSMSNGSGHFKNNEIVVLTDEFSASASEIFAGAMQDNDRGLVIGRRTFGKGLVQQQFDLKDHSAVRLTIARYYTPSGRSIQKDYKLGDENSYEQEFINRFTHGETFSVDSIKIDKSKEYQTSSGRTVYGGGGIMPDIFVPEDSTGRTGYLINVTNAGLIQQYAYQLADRYRDRIGGIKSIEDFKKILPDDDTLLEGFVDYAAAHGVPARWYYIRQSRDIILRNLKAAMARSLLSYSMFIEIYNEEDKVIEQALSALKSGKSPTNIIPTK